MAAFIDSEKHKWKVLPGIGVTIGAAYFDREEDAASWRDYLYKQLDVRSSLWHIKEVYVEDLIKEVQRV